ncbi:type II toxin-antitoxin system Phd/YefM family antitoxin [Streptomyces sp. NPDC056264]|uniref:type II toxin-antitoxin system Phd/YefM family antitoxin n=1 Tax=Streptomyces sp. NPDC056264 TaxID=3345767 RepID=UPI003AADFEEF
MKTLSASEAGKKIGKYFLLASQGEQFLITSHGRPFCVIGPAPEIPDEPETDEPETDEAPPA